MRSGAKAKVLLGAEECGDLCVFETGTPVVKVRGWWQLRRSWLALADGDASYEGMVRWPEGGGGGGLLPRSLGESRGLRRLMRSRPA